jgi:hypothetical protein
LTCRGNGVASAEHLNGQRGHEIRTSGRQNGTGFPYNGLENRRPALGGGAGSACTRLQSAKTVAGRTHYHYYIRDAKNIWTG